MAILSLVGALALFPFIGGGFMPTQDNSQFTVQFETPEGSSLPYTRGKAEQIVRTLGAIPGVDYTYTGTRLIVSLNGTAQELDYVDETASGEESRGGGATLRYRLRPTLVLSGSAYTNRSEFGAPEGRTETDRLYAIGLAKEWSRHWSSSLSVTRYERRSSATVGDFEQNVVYLNLTYRNR